MKIERPGLPEMYYTKVFFAEGIVNAVSAVLLFVAPQMAWAQFGFVAPPSPVELELIRWFAALVAILAYMGLRAPRHSRETVVALLLGDILWCETGLRLFNLAPQWTVASYFAFWVTVFLAVVRTTYLLRTL